MQLGLMSPAPASTSLRMHCCSRSNLGEREGIQRVRLISPSWTPGKTPPRWKLLTDKRSRHHSSHHCIPIIASSQYFPLIALTTSGLTPLIVPQLTLSNPPKLDSILRFEASYNSPHLLAANWSWHFNIQKISKPSLSVMASSRTSKSRRLTYNANHVHSLRSHHYGSPCHQTTGLQDEERCDDIQFRHSLTAQASSPLDDEKCTSRNKIPVEIGPLTVTDLAIAGDDRGRGQISKETIYLPTEIVLMIMDFTEFEDRTRCAQGMSCCRGACCPTFANN